MLRPIMLASALLLATVIPTLAQQSYIEDQDQQNQPQRAQRHMQGMQGMPWAAMMRGERMERLIGALSTGTFFRVKHGDDEIIVHCPARRQLQDCITAAAALAHEVPHLGQEADENDQNEQNEQQNDQSQQHQQH